MPQPFEILPHRRRTFSEWLLRRPSRANALVELEAELARSGRAVEVPEKSLAVISERYRTNLPLKAPGELAALYERAVRHALVDRDFSLEELEDLAHLKRLFQLDDRVVRRIHEKVTGEIYRAAAADVVRDGQVTEEERSFLNQLMVRLQVPGELAERIYNESAATHLQAASTSAAADGLLSPDEDRALEAMATSLGVTVPQDEKTRKLQDRMRLLWQIVNGTVPQIDVSERLQRGEVGYLERYVKWFEQRTVTKSIRYGGVTARVRIMKGLYYTAGQVAVERVQEEQLKLIDEGRLVLTNKRILFRGSKKNSAIALKKVIDFEPYSNGIELHKDTGRPILFKFSDTPEIVALTLDRAIRDANA